MIFLAKHQFRILTSGILLIIVNLMVNLEYRLVEATPTHKFRRSDRVPQSCQEICRTPGCIEAASTFMSIINETVDPCDDFYEFACGHFINSQVISDQAYIINTFTIAQTKIAFEVFNEVKKEISSSDLMAFKKVKLYYQNCMNQQNIEIQGTKPLLDILTNIGGWPVLLRDKWKEDAFDWKESVYKIQDQNFIIFFPFITTVSIDKKNSSNRIIKIENADTIISRTFLLDSPNNTLQKAYYDYMINIAVKLGAIKNVAIYDMKKVLDFEIKLYNIKTPAEELINQTDNQMSIKELSQRYPSIPWLELLNKIFNPSGISINETEIISVTDPKYISEVQKLIKVTPKKVLANYLALRVIHFTLMYMPEQLRNIASEFANVVEGTKKVVDRESWCLDELMQAFPSSLSSMYVRKYFNKQIIDKVVEILQNIKNQTKKNLEEIDWMDNKTRKAALEKLEAIKFSVGHAEELMDDQKINEYYRELKINSGSYLQSAFNITSFLAKQTYRALRKPENIIWAMNKNVAYVNAYSILQNNAIDIPAGFLRSFFGSDTPLYLNYGTVGSIIGHEITHGFDTEGRKYDKNGNLNNWWQTGTEEKFFKKAKCLIDQYNNFTIAEVGFQVNGIMTQGENIADNGGFKAAYHAYNDWVSRNKISEPCLPFLNFTQRQLFWLSAASSYCSKERPEYLRNLIATGVHSPGKARVTVSFANFKEFAEDFNCKMGSRMNPEKKCAVW